MKEHTFAFASLPCYILVLIGTVQVMGKSAQTCYHCESVPECAGKHGPVDNIKCNSGGEDDRNQIPCYEKRFENVVVERGCALPKERMGNLECAVVIEGNVEYLKCFCHPSNCNLELPNTLAVPSYSDQAKAKPAGITERKEKTTKEEANKDENPKEDKPQNRKDGKNEEEFERNVERKIQDLLMMMGEEFWERREELQLAHRMKEKKQESDPILIIKLSWTTWIALIIIGWCVFKIIRVVQNR